MSTIVVGIDGSPASLAALNWALNEARCHGSTVRAVHAWQLPYHQGEIGHLAVQSLHEPLTQTAHQTLDAALRHASMDANSPRVERVVAEGPPARVLIEESSRADLLVVGSRGRGGFAGLLLGSVGQQCAQGARCPIVIVHAAPAADPATATD